MSNQKAHCYLVSIYFSFKFAPLQPFPIYLILFSPLSIFKFCFRFPPLGVNYQDIAFNGAGLSGGAVNSVGGQLQSEQLGGLLAPVSVQNLAALAAMTQPVVSQAAPIAPAAAPQPTAPQLCKYH